MSESWGETVQELTGVLRGSGISPSGDWLILLGEAGARLRSAETGEIFLEIEAAVFVAGRRLFRCGGTARA